MEIIYIHLVADFSNQFVTYCRQFVVLLRLQRNIQNPLHITNNLVHFIDTYYAIICSAC